MLEIRSFEEGDEEAYVKVHNEGFSTEEWWMTAQMPISLADMAKLDYDATFMAEVEGQVVGLIDVKDYGNEAHIETLVVLHDFRREGIGTRLLEKAINFSRSRGSNVIRAETPAQNGSLFYEKNGFRLAEYAFLVEIGNPRSVEPYLDKRLYLIDSNNPYWVESSNRYWLPTEKDREYIESKTDLKVLAKFKVMKKEI